MVNFVGKLHTNLTNALCKTPVRSRDHASLGKGTLRFIGRSEYLSACFWSTFWLRNS